MNKRTRKLLLIALIVFTLLFMAQEYFFAPQRYMQQSIPKVEGLVLKVDRAGINQWETAYINLEKGDPLFQELSCLMESGLYVGTLFNRGGDTIQVMGQPVTAELTTMAYSISAMGEEGFLFAYSALADGREGLEGLDAQERWSPVHHFEIGKDSHRFRRIEGIFAGYDVDWRVERGGAAAYDAYMNENKEKPESGCSGFSLLWGASIQNERQKIVKRLRRGRPRRRFPPSGRLWPGRQRRAPSCRGRDRLTFSGARRGALRNRAGRRNKTPA